MTSPTSNNPSSESKTANVDAIRTEIDAIDSDLVRLLSQRAMLVQRIGAAKTSQGSAIFVPHREEAVFSKIVALNKGPLPDNALRAVWREIMSASLAIEQPLNICHFAEPGSFTHLAATLKFGESVTYTAVDDIATVFAEVEKGHANYGVVPIENSTDGSITDTIDAFLATNLRVINEMHLRIRQHLMAGCTRDEIKRVYSKHTVFRQCRGWLAANLPGRELIEIVSTTKAAERAAKEPGAAAIGHSGAAKAFGLPIIASDIQDNHNNITRFVVIGPPGQAAQPTGNDKTSIMFAVQDRPGALYDSLIGFHHAGINLCRIESRPNRRRPWEYLFFIDFTGHQNDQKVKDVLAGLAKHASTIEILGSYPKVERALNE
jgi:chorismate mutase / prephenate dehydratase